MLRPKKNSYKEFDNEKKFLRLENPPPTTPNNFSNGPSLNEPMNPSWTRIHHRHPKLKLWVCYVNLLSYKRVGVASQETVETLYEK